MKTVLIFVALGIAAVPAVAFVTLDAQQVSILGDPMGRGSGALVLLALFYVIWLPGTVFALIWLFDRLGFHYAVERRPPKPTRKERRRQKAGLELLASQERAAEQAARERAARPGAPQRPAAAGVRRAAPRPRPGSAGKGTAAGQISPPARAPRDDTNDRVAGGGPAAGSAVGAKSGERDEASRSVRDGGRADGARDRVPRPARNGGRIDDRTEQAEEGRRHGSD
jgi:hypothetical protein